MKIVAGLGAVDDYIKLARAGADEVFLGYVPYEWTKKYGTLFPLNRREVIYYNVQVTSFDDMKILKRMVDVYKVPVTITFNYIYYIEEQYEFIVEIMKKLIDIGFNEFIVADLAFLLYLKEKNLKCKIHLSGECAELNTLSMNFLNDFNISRYIFHRKNSIEDMRECIKNNNIENLQYEAFMLNERCHYTGAFCSSLHCDEMIHLCKMEYIMAKTTADAADFRKVDDKFEKYYEEEDCVEESYFKDDEKKHIIGESRCGLCALKKLKDAGITHLKVVGRGNFADFMEKDIKGLRKALEILEKNEDNFNYEYSIKQELFNNKCSKHCYY